MGSSFRAGRARREGPAGIAGPRSVCDNRQGSRVGRLGGRVMAEWRMCPRGHRWECSAGAVQRDSVDQCPVCGAEAVPPEQATLPLEPPGPPGILPEPAGDPRATVAPETMAAREVE